MILQGLMKMIFKNLFKKKKWLSEKVSDRLAAVAELELSDPNNKPIMHELAFNDTNDKVRRAALDKLNDFALWWQAFKHDVSDSIKKQAETIIVETLSGNGKVSIDPSLKTKFITECNKSQILEKVVFCLNDDDLTLSVLAKLDKESLYFKAITDSNLSQELKLTLIENTTELNQLRKLAKKVSAGALDLINRKIAEITDAAERPVKIEKNLRLLLARLNALKEKKDYQVLSEQLQALTAEWHDNEDEFKLLSESVQDELNAKFKTINSSIERIVAPLKEEFESQALAQQTAKKQIDNNQALNKQLDDIEGEIASLIASDTEVDQTRLSDAIKAISTQCDELELTTNDKTQLVKRCESIFNRANQVPKIKLAITNAAKILEALQQLQAPKDIAELNDFNPTFKQIKKQWQENQAQAEINLPADIATPYKTTLELLQEPVWALEKAQKQLFNQTRRKMSELDSLLNQGRYHNAFGLFKKLSFWMNDLNEYQQSQLAKKWQVLEEQIDQLHELEQSFSNPKKQELLDDIEKLATTPIADPTEQAHRVKLLRSNWQSLGHAGDEAESELNKQFDAFCEKAFLPCREHYQVLEKERSDNLAAKQLILEQLEKLNINLVESQVADWRELESVFVKLTKLWRETGLVDRDKVDDINNKYRDLCAPVRRAIAEHQKNNEAEKKKLVELAESIVASDDDLTTKVNTLKGLQNKWQKIGFAGKNVDQKLWREFRAINNPVFAQRDESYKQQKQESLAQYEDFLTQFETLEQQTESADEIAELRGVVEQVNSLLSELKGLSKSQFEKLKRIGQKIIVSCETNISQLREQQEKQIYVDLFAAVNQLAVGEKAAVNHLKPAWQSALNTNGKSDRKDVTLKLEIVAGIDSPEGDKMARNKIQMVLMSEKLEQGIEYAVPDLLEEWLAAGAIEESDLVLLDRIKPIFL